MCARKLWRAAERRNSTAYYAMALQAAYDLCERNRGLVFPPRNHRQIIQILRPGLPRPSLARSAFRIPHSAMNRYEHHDRCRNANKMASSKPINGHGTA